ncbi:integrase catalytic subunit [Roseibium sp. TrichSKD4]|nr:integrase catalytic subunit [Roseibium sp. TrichSKD4]
MVTPVAKRQAIAHACKQHGVSERRACLVLDIDRSTVRYRSVRPDDGDLRAVIRQVATERRRFGYRRIHVMLEREGVIIPFLMGFKTGLQAASFSFIAGVMPPMAMLGRSLLYVHSHCVA